MLGAFDTWRLRSSYLLSKPSPRYPMLRSADCDHNSNFRLSSHMGSAWLNKWYEIPNMRGLETMLEVMNSLGTSKTTQSSAMCSGPDAVHQSTPTSPNSRSFFTCLDNEVVAPITKNHTASCTWASSGVFVLKRHQEIRLWTQKHFGASGMVRRVPFFSTTEKLILH
jgi:hypothetical protein